MAEERGSLTEHLASFPAGAPVQGATFLGETPVLVRDDGTLSLGEPAAPRAVTAHPEGTILSSRIAGAALLTGGDDGLVVATDAAGATRLVHDGKGKWIDALAARPDGTVAFASGRAVTTIDGKGAVRTTSVPTTARGLAFAPKGYRLAIAHYNGASLWFPNAAAPPELYEWKGSHLSATFSPDGRFLVTAMQESALHGWRLVDRANMRMSGYPTKVRSMSWSADGDWLATSGADSCVLWPFRDKDGPMKKTPLECAVRKAKISCVAFHPVSPLLAVGYEDGWVLLSRPSDQAELLVRRPDDDRSAITALAWDAKGDRMLLGTASGEAGLLTLPEG